MTVEARGLTATEKAFYPAPIVDMAERTALRVVCRDDWFGGRGHVGLHGAHRGSHRAKLEGRVDVEERALCVTKATFIYVCGRMI